MDMTPRTSVLAVLAVVLAVATACGAEPAAETSTEAPPAATATTSPPAPATEPATPPTRQTTTAAPKAAKITVPDGVGMDYQSAQDAWRAAGLVVLPATDATGANRLPLVDANWVVLEQDLKAGSKVPAGSSITATVKKYSDN